MPARSVVYHLLSTDTALKEIWGIGPDSVIPAHSLETPPRDKYFLVMRWEEVNRASNLASLQEVLTVWAHISKSDSADFAPLSAILNRVRVIMSGATHVSGEDGTLTSARFNGYSGDFDDSTMRTITKNAEFMIVSR